MTGRAANSLCETGSAARRVPSRIDPGDHSPVFYPDPVVSLPVTCRLQFLQGSSMRRLDASKSPLKTTCLLPANGKYSVYRQSLRQHLQAGKHRHLHSLWEIRSAALQPAVLSSITWFFGGCPTQSAWTRPDSARRDQAVIDFGRSVPQLRSRYYTA
jgi:hypothetical protein